MKKLEKLKHATNSRIIREEGFLPGLNVKNMLNLMRAIDNANSATQIDKLINKYKKVGQKNRKILLFFIKNSEL